MAGGYEHDRRARAGDPDKLLPFEQKVQHPEDCVGLHQKLLQFGAKGVELHEVGRWGEIDKQEPGTGTCLFDVTVSGM